MLLCVKVKLNVNLVRDFWEPLLLLRVCIYVTLYSSLTLLISNKLAVNTQSGVTGRVLPLYTHTLPFCVSLLIHSKLARCLDLPSSGIYIEFCISFFVCVYPILRYFLCLSISLPPPPPPLSLPLSLSQNLLFVTALQMHLGPLNSTNWYNTLLYCVLFFSVCVCVYRWTLVNMSLSRAMMETISTSLTRK